MRALENRQFLRFLMESISLSWRQDARTQLVELLNCKQPFGHKFTDYENVEITALFGSEDEYNPYEQAQDFLSQFSHARQIRVPGKGRFFTLADLGRFLDIAFS